MGHHKSFGFEARSSEITCFVFRGEERSYLLHFWGGEAPKLLASLNSQSRAKLFASILDLGGETPKLLASFGLEPQAKSLALILRGDAAKLLDCFRAPGETTPGETTRFIFRERNSEATSFTCFRASGEATYFNFRGRSSEATCFRASGETNCFNFKGEAPKLLASL